MNSGIKGAVATIAVIVAIVMTATTFQYVLDTDNAVARYVRVDASAASVQEDGSVDYTLASYDDGELGRRSRSAPTKPCATEPISSFRSCPCAAWFIGRKWSPPRCPTRCARRWGSSGSGKSASSDAGQNGRNTRVPTTRAHLRNSPAA